MRKSLTRNYYKLQQKLISLLYSLYQDICKVNLDLKKKNPNKSKGCLKVPRHVEIATKTKKMLKTAILESSKITFFRTAKLTLAGFLKFP